MVYNLLFQAVSETLKEVAANPNNLGENWTDQDSEPAPKTWQEFMRYLTGEDPTLCPICKKGLLIVYEALASQKGPPPAEAVA